MSTFLKYLKLVGIFWCRCCSIKIWPKFCLMPKVSLDVSFLSSFTFFFVSCLLSLSFACPISLAIWPIAAWALPGRDLARSRKKNTSPFSFVAGSRWPRPVQSIQPLWTTPFRTLQLVMFHLFLQCFAFGFGFVGAIMDASYFYLYMLLDGAHGHCHQQLHFCRVSFAQLPSLIQLSFVLILTLS